MRIDRFSNVGLLIALHPELEDLFCRFSPRLDLTDLALSVRGFCDKHGCDQAGLLDALRREGIDLALPVPPPRTTAPPRPRVRFNGEDLDAELAWRDASRDWTGDDEDDGPEPDERSGRRGGPPPGRSPRRKRRAA